MKNTNLIKRIALFALALCCLATALPADAAPHHRPGPPPARHHRVVPAPRHHVAPAPRHHHHHHGPSRGWYNTALILGTAVDVLDIATRAYQPETTVVYQQPAPQTVVYQQPAPQTVVYQQPVPQTVIYQPVQGTTTTTTYAPYGVTYQTTTR